MPDSGRRPTNRAITKNNPLRISHRPTRFRSSAKSTIFDERQQREAAGMVSLTQRPFQPGNGPRPIGRERYAQKRSEIRWRTPRKRLHAGGTGRREKQPRKSRPPIKATGVVSHREAPSAPKSTSVSRRMPLTPYEGFAQSFPVYDQLRWSGVPLPSSGRSFLYWSGDPTRLQPHPDYPITEAKSSNITSFRIAAASKMTPRDHSSITPGAGTRSMHAPILNGSIQVALRIPRTRSAFREV